VRITGGMVKLPLVEGEKNAAERGKKKTVLECALKEGLARIKEEIGTLEKRLHKAGGWRGRDREKGLRRRREAKGMIKVPKKGKKKKKKKNEVGIGRKAHEKDVIRSEFKPKRGGERLT